MLSDFDPMATLPVSDLQRARDFYEGVLGFKAEGDPPDGVVYKAGSSSFLVYPSTFAGTNKGTAMSIGLPSGAFDAEVEDLRRKGVVFQTFEMDGMTWENGVAIGMDGSQEFKAVWFEDPDGNILNVGVEG